MGSYQDMGSTRTSSGLRPSPMTACKWVPLKAASDSGLVGGAGTGLIVEVAPVWDVGRRIAQGDQ